MSKIIPDSNGNTISFLDRDAILVRKDRGLNVIRSEGKNFTTNFNGFLRGWSAVDVSVAGNVFRMITTHLEPLDLQTRVDQAIELINGPANTNLPLILTGDLNSPPNFPPLNLPYNTLINAGFRDIWAELRADAGLTCCQGSDLLNADSSFIARIVYILFKNGWNPIETDLVGESQIDRTETGLWPSDHAGVSGSLHL